MSVEQLIMRRSLEQVAQRVQDAGYKQGLSMRVKQLQREAARLGAELFNRPAGARPLGFAEEIGMRDRFRQLHEQIRELRHDTTGKFR